MKSSIFALILFLSSYSISAQEERKFGDVTIADFEFPSTIDDTTAAAVILQDQGLTDYNHAFEPRMTNHLRILILNESELDRADIKIPHSKRRKVRKLEAASYNLENGKIIKSELDRRDVITEDVSDDLSRTIFSIPNVKPGSIIEYTYSVEKGSLSSLNTWYFQTSIPVLYSKYVVKMPAFYNYGQRLTGYIPLTFFDEKVENDYYRGMTFNSIEKTFISKNIPAFKEEPYISSGKNYISKVDLELISYQFPGENLVKIVPDNYHALVKEMEEDEYYKRIYQNNRFLNEDIERIVNDKKSDLENATAIYDFVQEKFEVDKDILSTNLRKIYNEKKGWEQDINMMLAAMLVKAGFEAYIVRTSTKSHGFVDKLYPSMKNFNYSICLLKLNDEEILLDASDKKLEFNMLKPSTINDQGLVISSKYDKLWIPLEYKHQNVARSLSEIEITADGSIKANVQLRRSGYNYYDFNRLYEDHDEYLDEFADKNYDFNILEHEIQEEKNFIEETLDIEISNSVSIIDTLLIFNPILIDRNKKNPFKLEERNLPVSLHAPIELKHSYNISLPENYEISSLPESLALSLPNNAGKFLFSCSTVGESIIINSMFSIKKTRFSKEEYFYLKELYTQMIERQQQEIVLTKK